jgi:16S rRNA processing protein RimM
MSNLINVGRVTGAHGIKGWVKIHSQTEPAGNIFNYQPWYVKTAHGVKAIELIDWRSHGKGYVAQLKGIDDRNQAEAFCPVVIAIEKDSLPSLGKNDFYWSDLEGCRVITTFDDVKTDLGVVTRIMPTGANDVLVVAGDDQSVDQDERLIPYVLGQFVTQVDIEEKRIDVDWDPDF